MLDPLRRDQAVVARDRLKEVLSTPGGIVADLALERLQGFGRCEFLRPLTHAFVIDQGIAAEDTAALATLDLLHEATDEGELVQKVPDQEYLGLRRPQRDDLRHEPTINAVAALFGSRPLKVLRIVDDHEIGAVLPIAETAHCLLGRDRRIDRRVELLEHHAERAALVAVEIDRPEIVPDEG